MSKDNPTTVAIVGIGSAGLRHAKNFASLGCTVVGVDSDPERLQMLDRVEGATGTRSLTEALEQSEIAVIATPASTHLPIARHAIEANCHLLIEKPLSIDLDGVGFLETATTSMIMLGYNLRYLPAIKKAKSLIDTSAIGQILTGSFEFGYDLRRWNPERDYRKTYSARIADGGGVLLDSIHELDLLLFLCGSAHSAIGVLEDSRALEIETEDRLGAIVTTRGGAILSVSLDYLSPKYHRCFRLIGTEGMIKWDWTTGILEFIRGEACAQFHWKTDVDASYIDEAKDLLECIAKNKEPDPGLRAGIESLRLALAIRESSASRCEVVLEGFGKR